MIVRRRSSSSQCIACASGNIHESERARLAWATGRRAMRDVCRAERPDQPWRSSAPCAVVNGGACMRGLHTRTRKKTDIDGGGVFESSVLFRAQDTRDLAGSSTFRSAGFLERESARSWPGVTGLCRDTSIVRSVFPRPLGDSPRQPGRCDCVCAAAQAALIPAKRRASWETAILQVQLKSARVCPPPLLL